MIVVAVTGLAFEARIADGPGVRTVVGGGDPRRLERALEAEFAHGAAALLSFGIAGGLDAAAVPGTWLVAGAVVGASRRWAVDATWAAALAQSLSGAASGDVVGTDTIIAAPGEKRALAVTSGAYALDMESHIVAAFAADHGVPFAVFRVIADPVTQALAPAATQGMRPDGRINQRAVFASLLRTPGQLPALMRNARDTRTAVRALSRGRRLLGPGLGYPDFR